jgi:hypothetical protein
MASNSKSPVILKEAMRTRLGMMLLVLASGCTAFSPPDKAQLLRDLCFGDAKERPTVLTFKPGEDGPPGALSTDQALQKAKEAAEKQLLRFRSANLKFDPCHTFPQVGTDTRPPMIRPVWRVNMRGSFEVFNDICIAGWQIILDARTGEDYQSGESKPYRETDCSAG